MPLVANRLSLLLPLIACLCREAVAQQLTEVPVPPEEPPFELVVRRANVAPNTVQIAPGASLPLEFELTWSGKAPVTIYWGNLDAADWVRLTIETPLETELVSSYNAPELKPEKATEKQIVTLGPGESVTGHMYPGSVPGGIHTFWFREPGPYELTASLEIHAADGDPSLPESWKSLGRVTARPVPFSVKYGDDPELDFRLVRGQVTDADGAPVPRADVYVHVERTSWSSPVMTPRFTAYDRAVTDEEGRFAFPSIPGSEPRLMLGVVHHSLPPVEKTVAVEPGTEFFDVPLQMSRGRTVTGTVVDREGRPLSGVALSRPWLAWMRFPDGTKTGADGRFEIDGLATARSSWIPVHKRDWEVVDESNRLEAGDGPASMTIVMQPRPSPDQLTGVARFENGKPAGDMDLTMWIDRADGDPVERRGHTDEDGRFAVELTSEPVDGAGSVTGLVELASPPALDPGDRWMARFEVPPGEREVELEFRREHSLTVHLRSAVPLPYELGVRVDLAGRPSHGSRPIHSQTERGDELESLTWRDLTAGRYRVGVQLEEASHYDWSEDVVIAFDGPTTEHEITFDIPEIHFGILRVKVQYPDGRKPANDETVWMDAAMAHGWQHIINGVATFPVVPVGPVTVSHSERNGIVGLPIRGRVEADGVTTLGPLILQRVEDAYGHVSGRVVMADGTPALGAETALQPFVSSFVSGEQGRVHGSGEFRVSGEPGTPFLVVNLKGCDLWPAGSVAEKASTNSPFGLQTGGLESLALIRSLVRPVTLTAGEEQVVDVMLPDVSFRDVTVELPGEAGVRVTLWTDLGKTWMHMEGGVDRDGSHTFRHVPDLPTRLFVSAWDWADRDHPRARGALVVPVPAGDAPVVRPDLSRTGRLRVRAKAPETAVERLSYSVRPADDELPARLTTLVGIGNMVERYVDEDGFVTFRLAPGGYTVTATLDGEGQSRNVEVEFDEEREVEFDFTTATE